MWRLADVRNHISSGICSLIQTKRLRIQAVTKETVLVLKAHRHYTGTQPAPLSNNMHLFLGRREIISYWHKKASMA